MFTPLIIFLKQSSRPASKREAVSVCICREALDRGREKKAAWHRAARVGQRVSGGSSSHFAALQLKLGSRVHRGAPRAPGHVVEVLPPLHVQARRVPLCALQHAANGRAQVLQQQHQDLSVRPRTRPSCGQLGRFTAPFLCRYSWWNFLPKIFFEEFSKVPYMYFGVRPPAAAPRSRDPATACERDPTHVQLAHRRLPHPAWARARNRP